jgi:hypothetical protein
MANYVTVSRRLIPRHHIAYVEAYDPEANPKFQTSRDFKGRVVLVNRDSLLIEEPPQLFAETNGFRMLPMDRIATNPAIPFAVETFAPADGYVPAKAYLTRLLWKDLDGNDQSKLLLTEPETVLAVAVQGEKAEPAPAGKDPVRRPSRRRPAAPSAVPTPEQ